MWISPEILNWAITKELSYVQVMSDVSRPYEMLDHAEHILLNASTNLQLIDVITNLKRAVTHRFRTLANLYEFIKIPCMKKRKPVLETLGILGIVRPKMLLKLIDIRNALEHRDAQPPAKETCQEFCELVWYFLRSTDNLAAFVTSGFLFESQTGYTLDITTGPQDSWMLDVYGFLPTELVCSEYQNNWFSIEDFETTPIYKCAIESHLPTDIYFHGRITGPPMLIDKVYRLYFSLLG